MSRHLRWIVVVRASIGGLAVAVVLLIAALLIPSIKTAGIVVGISVAGCVVVALSLGVWNATRSRKEREWTAQARRDASWRETAFPTMLWICFALGLYVLVPIGATLTLLAGLAQVAAHLARQPPPSLAAATLPWGVATAAAGVLLAGVVLIVLVIARRDGWDR
jgi:hypothetical protein